MKSARWLLTGLLALGLLSLTADSQAARLVRMSISLDGQVMLEGHFADNGRQDAATVWTYLDKAEFETVNGVRLEPNKNDPNTATLAGKLEVKVQYSGQAATASLALVRSKEAAGQWRLAPGEMARLKKSMAAPKAEAPKAEAPQAEAPQAAAASAGDCGFAIGKRLPITVVDYVTPTGRGHCGCVPVMIRNGKARGVVIFTKSLDDSVIALCRRLEKEDLILDSTKAFLVVLNRSIDSLKQPAAEWSLSKFIVSSARNGSDNWPPELQLPADTKIAVCTVNYSPIKFTLTTNSEKLTVSQQDEILAAVRELNGQPPALPPRSSSTESERLK